MGAGDLGDFNQDPLDYMSPQQMAALALGSEAAINGGGGGASPSLMPSSPATGAIPAAAMSRPAMSRGANLDMGAPPAPAVAQPPAAATSPMSPVIRAAQPAIPFPAAPAVDPRRAQLENDAIRLRQPLDQNAAQFRPHWYDYLKAAGLGALAGIGGGDATRVGERAVHGKFEDAEAARQKQLQGVEGSMADIDKAQGQDNQRFRDQLDVFNAVTGQQRQNRIDSLAEERQANDDRRLTVLEKGEEDRKAAAAAADKRAAQKEADEAAHRKTEEGHWSRQDAIADRNASTKENNEASQDKARQARYSGVSESNRKAVDRVYSDRDRRIDALNRQHTKEIQTYNNFPNGPTMQKMKTATDAEYQRQLQSIHDSTEQRIKQLGGTYDRTSENPAPGNSGGKYKAGDQIPSGKYAGMFVTGVTPDGQYQLSKNKPTK